MVLALKVLLPEFRRKIAIVDMSKQSCTKNQAAVNLSSLRSFLKNLYFKKADPRSLVNQEEQQNTDFMRKDVLKSCVRDIYYKVLNSSLSFKYLDYNLLKKKKIDQIQKVPNLDRTFLSLQFSVSYPNADTIQRPFLKCYQSTATWAPVNQKTHLRILFLNYISQIKLPCPASSEFFKR